MSLDRQNSKRCFVTIWHHIYNEVHIPEEKGHLRRLLNYENKAELWQYDTIDKCMKNMWGSYLWTWIIKDDGGHRQFLSINGSSLSWTDAHWTLVSTFIMESLHSLMPWKHPNSLSGFTHFAFIFPKIAHKEVNIFLIVLCCTNTGGHIAEKKVI